MLNCRNITLFRETHHIKKKKTCILSFHIITYQNAKMHGKHLKWGKESTFPEKYLLSFYERVIGTKMLKSMKSSYMEIQNIITNKVFFFFFYLIRTKKHMKKILKINVSYKNAKMIGKYRIWGSKRTL